MSKAEETLPKGTKLRALIGPHAGLRYSGPNQAWAYRNIRETDFDRVVLMGPSHKVYLDFVAQTACTEYACPLGNIAIDAEVVRKLETCKDAKF
jgi:AmmeMemoRadiSam system protein B